MSAANEFKVTAAPYRRPATASHQLLTNTHNTDQKQYTFATRYKILSISKHCRYVTKRSRPTLTVKIVCSESSVRFYNNAPLKLRSCGTPREFFNLKITVKEKPVFGTHEHWTLKWTVSNMISRWQCHKMQRKMLHRLRVPQAGAMLGSPGSQLVNWGFIIRFMWDHKDTCFCFPY